MGPKNRMAYAEEVRVRGWVGASATTTDLVLYGSISNKGHLGLSKQKGMTNEGKL